MLVKGENCCARVPAKTSMMETEACPRVGYCNYYEGLSIWWVCMW